MDVLPANFQKLSEQLLFRNRSGQMRPEIQTAFILELQWKTLDGWMGNRKVIRYLQQSIMMPNN